MAARVRALIVALASISVACAALIDLEEPQQGSSATGDGGVLVGPDGAPLGDGGNALGDATTEPSEGGQLDTAFGDGGTANLDGGTVYAIAALGVDGGLAFVRPEGSTNEVFIHALDAVGNEYVYTMLPALSGHKDTAATLLENSGGVLIVGGQADAGSGSTAWVRRYDNLDASVDEGAALSQSQAGIKAVDIANVAGQLALLYSNGDLLLTSVSTESAPVVSSPYKGTVAVANGAFGVVVPPAMEVAFFTPNLTNQNGGVDPKGYAHYSFSNQPNGAVIVGRKTDFVLAVGTGTGLALAYAPIMASETLTLGFDVIQAMNLQVSSAALTSDESLMYVAGCFQGDNGSVPWIARVDPTNLTADQAFGTHGYVALRGMGMCVTSVRLDDQDRPYALLDNAAIVRFKP